MSATDHGPSNHDDELRQAMRDLVDQASLPGLEAHLDVVRGRTRRRRAAKKVALGATTLCVAGALGVAAISLPQTARPAPVPPADSPSPSLLPSPVPSETPVMAVGTEREDLVCGAPAPALPDEDLSIDVPDLSVRTGAAVTAPVVLRLDGEAPASFEGEPTGAYVVTRDGVIVASALPPDEVTGTVAAAPGSPTSWQSDVVASATCGPGTGSEPLPAGDYQLFAVHRIPLQSATDLLPEGTADSEVLPHTWLTSAPVPLTVTPEPAPVEIRDSLADDTSMVFEAFRKASETGGRATVDLTLDARIDPRSTLVDEGEGSWTLTVRRSPDVAPRERATSDDGWQLELHGGTVFHASAAFPRIVGTYVVTMNTSAEVPTFVLEVLDGGTPSTAPPTADRDVCTAFRTQDGSAPSSVYETFASDLEALAADLRPAGSSQIHHEVRSRWVDAPRFWWALQSHEVLTRDTGDGGDFVNAACQDYWG